jgi:hypothetical protein
VRSTWRARLEHDALETEARSEGMELIISAGRQDKPGIGGVHAQKPPLTLQFMHVHSHGFLTRLPARSGCQPRPCRLPSQSLAASLADVHILRTERREADVAEHLLADDGLVFTVQGAGS